MTYYEQFQLERYGSILPTTENQELYENRDIEMQDNADWVENQVENEMVDYD